MFDGKEYGKGKGASKKKAEQEAAKIALAEFQKEEKEKTNAAFLNVKPPKVTKRSIARAEKDAQDIVKGKKK